MSIDRGDFDSISEDDLIELVTAQVPEGLRIEYKVETYKTKDAERREFLKDISSFANTQGGHLILGMKEAKGIAKAADGLGELDSDAELLRLEQIACNGLEPRISGLRMKAIPLSAGGHILLLRIPRSWNPPHRVISQNSNRFYMRNSSGVYEPNVGELRTLFTESASALEQAKSFRKERMNTITSRNGQRPLQGNGRLILHIVPIASLSGTFSIDIEHAYQQHSLFKPISIDSYSPRFNYHGFINERGNNENYGYTQIFRNGILEATKAEIVRDREGFQIIAGAALEKHFFARIFSYIIGLKKLNIPAPLIIMLTLEGVHEASYYVKDYPYIERDISLPEDTLHLPECVLEDYGEEIDIHRAVQPAFDALWNAIGYSRSEFFNEYGLWVGNNR